MTASAPMPARAGPKLPPLLTGHAAPPGRAAFQAALEMAAAGTLGAGDAVVECTRQQAAMAIVLEPDVARDQAMQMAPLMMVALASSLAAVLPPKVAVELQWPGAVLINGAPCCWVDAAIAPGTDESVPDWMVVGMQARLAPAFDEAEPGHLLGLTNLAEEGGADLTAESLIESVAARFLGWLDDWQNEGFDGVRRQWFFLARGRTEPAEFQNGGEKLIGTVRGLTSAAGLQLAIADGGMVTLAWPDRSAFIGIDSATLA